MTKASGSTEWHLESESTDTDLTEEACWTLLESEPVGRLAFVDDGAVHIYPVNHIVHDRNLYFRTSPYGIVGTAIRHQSVAFEIDSIDSATRSGWSVLVRGTASWVVDSDRIDELAGRRSPEPWASGTRTMYIEVTPHTVSGRRIGKP